MLDQVPAKSGPTIHSYAWLIAIAGLLLLLGGGVAYWLNQAWAVEAQIVAGGGLLLLLLAVLLRPDVVRRALTGRPARYSSNAAIMSLVFILILGLINFINFKNNREYDLTENGLFTLSEQTIQVLQNIDEPVQIIGFFQAGDLRLKWAEDYLERYSHYTEQLTYEFHDPNIEPALAQSFELSNYGLVFVSRGNHHEVSGVDEQSITSGLIRVTHDKQRAIHFITGHGEHRIDDSGPEGYDALKQALERENYVVNNLNLASMAGYMPPNTAVLILAGADRELLDTEVQLISDWQAGGGKLMILADPLEPAPLGQTLQKYGLFLGNDFVIEDANHALLILGPKGPTPQVIAPLIVEYPYHEITDGLNGFQSFFPFARSITIDATESLAADVSALISTSQGSWAETDLQSPEPEYNEDLDYPGPFHLGAAVEDYENGARLVLFGNAGFITNQNASPQMANLDIFINAVNWLAEEEELISIRPQQPENRRLFLTPLQTSLILFSSVVLIPLAILAAGIVVWWKRR